MFLQPTPQDVTTAEIKGFGLVVMVQVVYHLLTSKPYNVEISINQNYALFVTK
jgi:hypothetical protein